MAEPERDEILIGRNGYHQGRSTSGIVYNDEINATFFYLHDQFAPFQLPQAGGHYIACSSSHGLIALRNTATNRYFIGNPFPPEHDPNAPNAGDPYVTLPPTPRPHDFFNSDVVLATDFSIPAQPVYYLVCAVQAERHNYVFDVYSSELGHWSSFPDISLGRRIVLGSGVSCGRFAFWLTMYPQSVFRFNIMGAYGLEADFSPVAVLWPMPVPADVLHHRQTWLQLGRENDGRLGLVVVNGAVSRAELYIFKKDGTVDPSSPRFLNIRRQDQPNPNSANAVQVVGDVNNATSTGDIELACQGMPQPVRFESFKMEVLLWVDDRMVLWEENVEAWPLVDLVQVLEAMPVRPHVVHGFAHVHTALLPGIFRLRGGRRRR